MMRYMCGIHCNNVVTDVHDATNEDMSDTDLYDGQGGWARKERGRLGSPVPSVLKKKGFTGLICQTGTP